MALTIRTINNEDHLIVVSRETYCTKVKKKRGKRDVRIILLKAKWIFIQKFDKKCF